LRLFLGKPSVSNDFLLKQPSNPMGENKNDPLRLDFDRQLKLEFHGSTVTSDAGLLAYRELDDALALSSNAATGLHDTRTGQNTQHSLLTLLRQSLYSRLAGYEDINDAERLCLDPAMRIVVGGRAKNTQAASTRRCAARGDFEVYVAEKSRLRRLRGLVKRGQEFIRVRNLLLRTLHRSTMALKTRNCGPGRRLSGKDRSIDALTRSGRPSFPPTMSIAMKREQVQNHLAEITAGIPKEYRGKAEDLIWALFHFAQDAARGRDETTATNRALDELLGERQQQLTAYQLRVEQLEASLAKANRGRDDATATNRALDELLGERQQQLTAYQLRVEQLEASLAEAKRDTQVMGDRLDEGAGRKSRCPKCGQRMLVPSAHLFLRRLVAYGLVALFALVLLTSVIAKIAHTFRSRTPISIAEDASFQIQADEATLLLQLVTVPELRLLDDDRIRNAKEIMQRNRGLVRFSGRSRTDEGATYVEKLKAEGASYVEELNRTICEKANQAGLNIEWKFMEKSERDGMIAKSLELRRKGMVGVERTNSSMFTSSESSVANELSKSLDLRYDSSGFLPTIVQVLQVEPEPSRMVLISQLDRLRHTQTEQRKESAKELAARALYDNSMEVREAALRALENQDMSVYVPELLKGMDYPWTPVVWRAAYALRKLGPQKTVPELTKMLEKKPMEESTGTVKELVRVSHLHNCLFCHKPAFDKSGATVPIPGEPLPSTRYYDKPDEMAVDPGATCLHQDFSVILPVENSGSWPVKQRFDFTTRVRPATKADAQRLEEGYRERRKAAHYALEGIVAREGKKL
jgi:hypothetical protein